MAEFDMLEWNDDMIRNFWDFESQYPERYFTFQFGENVAFNLRKYIANREVLDYGCGTGYMTPHLVKVGAKVSSTDFSMKSIESVNATYKHLAGFRGATIVEKLLNEKARFEVILCFEVIEHLTDSHLQSTLENIKNLLKDGGTVIFSTPNSEKLEESYVLCPSTKKVFHRWQHVRSWTPSTLASYLSNAGFTVKSIFTTNFALAPQRNFLRYAYHTLSKIKGGRSQQDPHLICICQIS